MIKKHWLATLLIIAIVIIRFWNFPNWFGFDYDQEVNAWLAKSIVVDHKPILIGPQTSVGGMFVGPLFNYLIALFYFFGRMNPMATVGLNVFVSLFTLGALYAIASKVFSARTGIIAILVYGLSYNLTNFDRVSWNPLPIHIVSLCIVYFLWRFERTKNPRNLVISSVFVGIFLHLHFTAVFLIAYLFLVLFIYFRQYVIKKPLYLGLVTGVILLFVSPILLFDLRHGFLISSNFIQFVTTGSHMKGPNIVTQFMSITNIIVEFFRAIVYNETTFGGKFISGIALAAVLVISFFNEKPERKIFLKMCWLLVLIPAVLLPFYSGPLPSHYLQFLMPVYVIFISVLADRIMDFKVGKVLMAISFCTLLLYNVPQILSAHNGLSLQNKMNAVKYIVNDSKKRSFKVDFVTDPGIKTGFNYLFWLNGRDLVEDVHIKTERDYKIIIPYYLVKSSDLSARFGGIGVIKL